MQDQEPNARPPPAERIAQTLRPAAHLADKTRHKLTGLSARWGHGRTIGVALAVVAILIAGWWAFGRGTPVKAVAATRGDAAQVVYATGIVEPINWAKIATLQRKRIIDICTCEGEAVKKGQVLARLDDGEERARLRELEARLARVRADAERIAKLVGRGVTSQTSLDEKRTQVREYEARVAAQMDRIADLELKAPMDGVVLRRDGEIGEIAGIGTNEALLWVGQPKPLRIVADVNEDDVAKVKPGQVVLLRHEGHTGGPLQGQVDRLTPKGDPETKTFRVYLRLPDDTPLLIGMSVEANIVVRDVKDAVLVPAEAIGNGTVQVVQDGELVARRVTIGIRGSRRVEIRDGVTAGEVVVSPYRGDLEAGASVRVERAAEP